MAAHSHDWFDIASLATSLGVPADYPNPVSLPPLTHIGDPLADNALASAPSQGRCPLTLFDAILERRENGTANVFEVAVLKDAERVPDWVDWKQIERGQEIYWRHAGAIGVVLLHATLAGGFANPRVNTTLLETGYLSNPTKVRRRMFETGQIIMEAMDGKDALRPGNQGWKSILRVRMLHASVRERVRRKEGKDGGDGGVVPINQADMIGTILGFQCSVIVGLTYFWTYLSHQEREDYTHLWRYIAHLIGVQDTTNPLAHGFPSTCACLRDYLRLYFYPDATSKRLTATVLGYITKPDGTDKGMGVSYTLGVGISRRLIGHPLADALEIPRVGVRVRVRVIGVSLLLWLLGTLSGAPGVGPWLIGRRKQRLPGFMRRIRGRIEDDVAPADPDLAVDGMDAKNIQPTPFLSVMLYCIGCCSAAMAAWFAHSVWSSNMQM
ncbi:putative E3 ubiquitin-protein ligase [Borealophlyctis nickersoniae]|nr:putative E3 ubiquitin-protein ligase [Borealophlyctis nickersoniae]